MGPLTWHPDTQQHLDSIDQAINEMESQVNISGQKMLTIVDINQGQTIRAIDDYYNNNISPAMKRLLEDFRAFVKSARDRYQAAIQQDQDNAKF